MQKEKSLKKIILIIRLYLELKQKERQHLMKMAISTVLIGLIAVIVLHVTIVNPKNKERK